jgi:5,10-methylenetetrahydrofolate reductase
VDRAWEYGFHSLVVVGGDASVPPTRCVKHGWQLRSTIRKQQPGLRLGAWANPHRDTTKQIEYLINPNVSADFFLTQIVSHHDLLKVEQFLDVSLRKGLSLPGLYGVFFYRSANQKTLTTLSRFLPVPREHLLREFSAGTSAEEICARSVRALRALGVRHIYISNLPIDRASSLLKDILQIAECSSA